MDAELWIKNHPIIRWIVAPIILAMIFSFADYADASEHRINLDAKKAFEATRSQFYSGDPSKPENYAQFPRDVKCSQVSDACEFWGDIDLNLGNGVIFKHCSITFYYNRNDNKVFRYALNYDSRSDDDFRNLVKHCSGKYGKPANVSESVQRYYGWATSGRTIVGGSVDVSTHKVVWDFPDFRCTVTLRMNSIWLVEENK
jgi:hypothetical protein